MDYIFSPFTFFVFLILKDLKTTFFFILTVNLNPINGLWSQRVLMALRKVFPIDYLYFLAHTDTNKTVYDVVHRFASLQKVTKLPSADPTRISDQNLKIELNDDQSDLIQTNPINNWRKGSQRNNRIVQATKGIPFLQED